ncbi:MAG: aldo/keto reductase [Christensenella sp.]|uniref:aldo/keto reductase n=1 Tax=Christensenella sp. TaxID=1935934 RepID=UPI002B214B81|nr:aldo/keto reductase [Christensenella sp.]MEA5004096.1 aldo/keto reductase [Christensenella sp.]
MKKLGFGLMRLPLQDKDDEKSVDTEQVKQMVDAFLARGFTYFDTAYMYHEFFSEQVVREALVKRYPRDSFTLTTKMPVMFLEKEEDMERIFSEQLDKCGVEYFDYYLLHNLNISNYEIAQKLDGFGFIQKKKEEGKIRRIGFSYHDNAVLLDEILTAHPEVEVVQLQMNYLDWENESIQSRKCYEVARRHGKDVIVMEPVKGGMLANIPQEAEHLLREYAPDMSAASWAVRFAASHDGVLTVLSGMSDLTQLRDNMGYMESFVPFNEQEHDIVRRVVDTINQTIAIPCTACGYCVDGCPKHIAIPTYFALYNLEKQANPEGFSVQGAYYENYAQRHGKASDCIDCKNCEKQCPQHLAIVQGLRDVAKVFE